MQKKLLTLVNSYGDETENVK